MNEAPFDIKEYEKITPQYSFDWRAKKLIFYAPTSNVLWRAQTFYTKEPETIEWLSTFKPGEIYFDIGANVGLYAIAAAAAMDVEVYAFEPEASNFEILTRNIYYNKLSNNMKSYCIALGNETTLGDLFLSGFGQGGSSHMFGEPLDIHLQPVEAGFVQGCVCYTIDDLIQKNRLPVPHHIKIDVDGLEHKILEGGAETLANKTVKSVLVELNTNIEVHRNIVPLLENYGFSFDQVQVDSSMVKEGWNSGLGNYIFRR